MATRPQLHLIIPTHTAQRLWRTLLGVAHQSRPPDTLTITCDTDDDAILDLATRFARERSAPITLVRRAHQGVERLAQVRNNAVRALLAQGASPDDRLVFLDGDCCPAVNALELHEALARKGDLVIAYRVNLSPEQTQAFDEAALAAGNPPVAITPAQRASLARRHRRYVRHALLRRLGLVKSHKPKPLGGHHSVSLALYRAVNGHDEQYHSWGTEDDDFGRRVYRAGATPVIAVRDILVYHQWHETRQPGAWPDRDNARRFRAGGPMRCLHGLESPLPQPPVRIDRLQPGKPPRRLQAPADIPTGAGST